MDNPVRDFLKGRSASTTEAYLKDLGQLEDFLKGHGDREKPWENASPELLKRYLEEIRKRMKYRESTMARKKSAIRSFYKFLTNRGVIQEDPTRGLEPIKVKRTKPAVLSERQVGRILEAAKQSKRKWKGERDAAMLELIMQTGLRISEIVSLNRQDIGLPECHLRYSSPGGTREIPITSSLAARLGDYLTPTGEETPPKRRDTDALFITKAGRRISRQSAWSIVTKCGMKAGIRERITPSALRQNVVIKAIEKGETSRIRQQLGISYGGIYRHRRLNGREQEAIKK